MHICLCFCQIVCLIFLSINSISQHRYEIISILKYYKNNINNNKNTKSETYFSLHKLNTTHVTISTGLITIIIYMYIFNLFAISSIHIHL